MADKTPRDLVQWAAPSACFLLHPLSVVGYRHSVGHHHHDAGGWVAEARRVRQQSGLFGHPGYVAWLGAVEGAIDVLVTVASLSIDSAFLPPPPPPQPASADDDDAAAPVRKPSPYAHSWQTALLAAAERVVWTCLTRPLHAARNVLLAQLPDAAGRYRYTGQWASLQALWAEHGPQCFTRSLAPAVAHELTSSVLFSLYDAQAPLQSFAHRVRIRNPWLYSFVRSLCLAGDEVARTLLITLVARPLEVVVRRLDVQGSGIEPLRSPYLGVVDCARRIWIEEGLRGFYRGTVPELVHELAPASLLLVADLLISCVVKPPEAYAI